MKNIKILVEYQLFAVYNFSITMNLQLCSQAFDRYRLQLGNILAPEAPASCKV